IAGCGGFDELVRRWRRAATVQNRSASAERDRCESENPAPCHVGVHGENSPAAEELAFSGWRDPVPEKRLRLHDTGGPAAIQRTGIGPHDGPRRTTAGAGPGPGYPPRGSSGMLLARAQARDEFQARRSGTAVVPGRRAPFRAPG